MDVDRLARQLSSGALLALLERECGGFELLAHWQQGEFHHDFVIAPKNQAGLPGPVLVVSTNCNAGVKEVLCLPGPPTQGALWRSRCPANEEFSGTLPPVLAVARTRHWFDPCTLLAEGARSEYRPEFRERQTGGGWRLKEE